MHVRSAYRAEGELFGAAYADGLFLGLAGECLPEGEEGALVAEFMSHLLNTRIDMGREGIRPCHLDKWFSGAMEGFGQRLRELKPAASLADRSPSRPR
ncbi:hypothetical protein SAMN02799631_00388 [Methylobacterium sp. 174MFSha1.1]|uniref:hypothetical protein n=1 Tax=Methylobacterium sp. 174MFSha1.1 TaxID=1502749 RepID=UPI0008E4378C|nr:hypothetical protein [Methylobacterium sp. 174MFSha1.1]SFU38875.1 hypothetical protein SAMN02799631_00388 [Methylobacterium sp. 174MFSha1.1]